MSNQKTSKDLTSATSSQESEDGLTPSNSQDGMQTDLFGQAVAPAKVSQSQDNVKVQVTSVTSGLRGIGSSESQSLQQSLASKLLERLGSGGLMPSQQILKRVTTDSLRAFCQDTLSEPITNGKDYGSWPTPTALGGGAADWKNNKRGHQSGNALKTAASTWPTPRTVDGTRGAVRLNKRGKRQSDTTGIEYGATLGDSVYTWPTPRSSSAMTDSVESSLKRMKKMGFEGKLEQAVALTKNVWPTPSARDYKGGYQGGRMRNGHISTDSLDITAQLTGEQSNGLNVETAKPARSRLNPMFSLWLMGFPKSWIQKAIPENTITQARSKA